MNLAFKTINSDGELVIGLQTEFVYKDTIKAQGGRWNPNEKRWELPYTYDSWDSINMSIPMLVPCENIQVDLVRNEDDTNKPIRNAPPMPLKKGITPFKHQFAAYADCLYIFGVTGGNGI